MSLTRPGSMRCSSQRQPWKPKTYRPSFAGRISFVSRIGCVGLQSPLVIWILEAGTTSRCTTFPVNWTSPAVSSPFGKLKAQAENGKCGTGQHVNGSHLVLTANRSNFRGARNRDSMPRSLKEKSRSSWDRWTMSRRTHRSLVKESLDNAPSIGRVEFCWLSTHAQVKWHNRRIHNQGSDVPGRRKPGERSGVSPPSQMRATRWADTHRSPSYAP